MAKELTSSSTFVGNNHDDWEEIKKEITCCICYELFTDPRTLPCLHTFCKSCIQRSVNTGLAEVPEGFFECPLCRAHVPLPARGIDGISANFSIKRLIEIYSKRQEVSTDTVPKCRLCTSSNPATMWCIECDGTVCSECFASHKRMKIFSQHKVIPMQEFTSDPKHAIKVFLNPGVCPAHPDQVLKFYCYTCDQTICVECALLDHPRGEHKFDSIGKVIVEEKEEVLKTAAILEPMRDKVCEAINRIATSKDDITDKHQLNMKQVNSLFDELHQILEQQREEMLKKLDIVKNASHKSLNMQNSDLAFLQSKLKSCREFVSNLMDNGSANEILSFKRQIADRVTELTNLLEQAPLQPVCTADSTVSCIDCTKFVTMCQSVCYLFCSPYPPNCVVNKPIRHYTDHGGQLVNAVSVTVSLQDRHGNAVVGQCKHLEATSSQVTHVTVKEQDAEGRGVYNITYQPLGIEADDMMIKWSGHDIIRCNVPGLLRDYTALRVVRPVEEESDHEEDEEEDEEEGDSVKPVDGKEEGDKPKVITKYGPDGVKFGEVFGLCNGPKDELIVADTKYHKLIVFDKDLQYSHTIGEEGEDRGQFNRPTGVTCDNAGQLYVADNGNNRVQVITLTGEFVYTIGTEGNGDGEFNGPARLLLSSTGLLFVCDTGNKRVQVFDTQRNYQFQYSFGHGKFIVDLSLNATEDKLFAVDGTHILAFTPQGQFLHSIAIDPCSGVFPLSICCTSDGHLVLATYCSSILLSVYHEDGTLVCAGENIYDEVIDSIMKGVNLPRGTYAVHTRNNQIMVFCEGYNYFNHYLLFYSCQA